MDIGPLEYVVIGYEDDHFTNEILPALGAIQESDLIRVVDLVFVNKAADGTVTMQEISELREEERQLFGGMMRISQGCSPHRILSSWPQRFPQARRRSLCSWSTPGPLSWRKWSAGPGVCSSPGDWSRQRH